MIDLTLRDEILLLEALAALDGLVRELDFGEHLAVLRGRRSDDVESEDVRQLDLALARARAAITAVRAPAVSGRRRAA